MPSPHWSTSPLRIVNVRGSAKLFAANEAKPAARSDHGGPAYRMSVLLLDAAPPAPTDTPKAREAVRLKAVYLLPSSWHPRCPKRIRCLAREGLEPTALAFERTGFDLDIDLPYVSLGRLGQGRYWRRPFALLRAVPRVVPHLRGAAVIYCSGLDLLALAWLCHRLAGTRARLVYEVADVREIQCGRGLSSRLIRAAERFLLRRVAALVVTSPAYIDGYYDRFRPLPPVFLIENKFGHEVEPAAIEAVRKTPVCREPDVIKIGYFGAIRCMRSLDLLFELAARAGGRVRVQIRGYATTEAIRRRLDEAPANVIVEGPFKPAADMPAMYQAVDLGWVAHYHAATNFKMARSNRFYDSCMFGRPMIAQRGTMDAVVIEREDLGLIIDAPEYREQAMHAMLALTPVQIAAWRDNVLALPRRVFAHEPGDEHADLARFLAGAAPVAATRRAAL